MDGNEFLHVCECPVSGSDRVAIEQRPERVTRGVTLVYGGKHPLDDAARHPIIPRRIVPELPASPIARSTGSVELAHINFFIFELMLISGLVQRILVHRSLEIKGCFITVEDIQPSVDFDREGFLYSRRVVGLCVYVDGKIVRFSVRAVLPFCEIEGDIEIMRDLLISLSFATEAVCFEYSADLLPNILRFIKLSSGL